MGFAIMNGSMIKFDVKHWRATLSTTMHGNKIPQEVVAMVMVGLERPETTTTFWFNETTRGAIVAYGNWSCRPVKQQTGTEDVTWNVWGNWIPNKQLAISHWGQLTTGLEDQSLAVSNCRSGWGLENVRRRGLGKIT